MERKKIVITGSEGFIGRNLISHLSRNPELLLININRENPLTDSTDLSNVTHVYHLAGANRPPNESEYVETNVGFTEVLIKKLLNSSSAFDFIFASSIQARFDNSYGKSKKEAEDLIEQLSEGGRFKPYIYRLPNVFGKWGKPNYNSVVATFCYNIARNLPIRIDDPMHELPLVYIEDVIRQFVLHLDSEFLVPEVHPVYHISVGDLGNTIAKFKSRRESFKTPVFDNELSRKLYATYLSYLPKDEFAINATLNTDSRGSLFELVKQEDFGQIFVSTTKPGITRGNHFHNTKAEKFCVIKGEGLIQFRKLGTDEIIEYPVRGEEPSIVDIPPGYTHNITNTGANEMVTLFWASEIFDQDNPDTTFEKVADE